MQMIVYPDIYLAIYAVVQKILLLLESFVLKLLADYFFFLSLVGIIQFVQFSNFRLLDKSWLKL